jgi:hypothetical protein
MHAHYDQLESAIFMAACQPCPGLDEELAGAEMDQLYEEIGYTSSSLGIAFWKHFGVVPLLAMPKIRLLPAEAAVVSAVLQQCMPVYQEIYCKLMERWSRLGFRIKPAGQSIALEAPYGERRIQLARLTKGTPDSWPEIVLTWQALDRMHGFPAAAVKRYREQVEKITPLQRNTGSTVHIRVTPAIEDEQIKALIKAMRQLARSVRVERVEPRPRRILVTPENICRTLDLCNPPVREIFDHLVTGWQNSGGSVLSRAAGRISLRLKSEPINDRDFSGSPQIHTLIVLTAAVENRAAAIGLAWDLGKAPRGFLNHIPEEVGVFEAIAAGLPGFAVQGSRHSIHLDNPFNLEHAEALLRGMLRLKEAAA